MNAHSKSSNSNEEFNYGPISKINLEIRPLTILVRPYNSDKSYFANLNNALQRTLAKTRIYPSYYSFTLETESHSNSEFAETIEKTAENLLKQLKERRRKDLVFDRKFRRLAKRVFNKRLSFFANEEIMRCYGTDGVKSLPRKIQSYFAQIKLKTSVKRKYNPGMCVNHLASNFTELSPEPKSNFVFPSSIPIPQNDSTIKKLKEEAEFVLQYSINSKSLSSSQRNIFGIHFVDIIISLIDPSCFGPLTTQEFYLPTDRTGVKLIHNVVVNSLIASASMTELRKTSGQASMTRAHAKFLVQLIENERKRGREKYLSNDVKKEILRGRVKIKLSEDMNDPIFSYQLEGLKEDLPLENASSMVSELAPIVLFLRYAIKPGMLLIIEAPESRLNPVMQVKLANQLAELVQKGVLVFVTTNSDWLVSALANIVYHSDIRNENKKIVSNEITVLNREQVGIWSFQDYSDKNGAVVKEIKLDGSLQYLSDYDEGLLAQIKKWDEITDD
ncbi:MAG: AAA family ATPase [Chloroflexi bacterium]|nr:AAA family ATPase [Chloroflexota bacterium]